MGDKGNSKRKPKKVKPVSIAENPTLSDNKVSALTRDTAKPSAGTNKKPKK